MLFEVMMLPETKLIGENLRQFMTANKITFRQAAERSGLAISTISELINGQDKKISYYFILADSINMPVKSMLNVEYSLDDSALLLTFNKITQKQKTLLKKLIETMS